MVESYHKKIVKIIISNDLRIFECSVIKRESNVSISRTLQQDIIDSEKDNDGSTLHHIPEDIAGPILVSISMKLFNRHLKNA